MTDAPFVSVVIATWNRSVHILPTLRSVLEQSFRDFEIVVVGDCCEDDTEKVLAPFLGDRVRWYNLAKRCGSQSFPNNFGIARARGEYIAYLGHDDIWEQHHLAMLVALVKSHPDTDVAVSGLVFHGPPGSDVFQVTGMFDESSASLKHFFPPSSVLHMRGLVRRFGLWRAPDRIQAPVDSDFFLRMARGGSVFRSTGALTVHKFAAGHRYLSYLKQDSSEQEAMLAQVRSGPDPSRQNSYVEISKRTLSYMIHVYPDFSALAPGQLANINRDNKGLRMSALLPLTGPVSIPQRNDPRALDWQPLAAGTTWRWSGPNPRPKILINYSSSRMVLFELQAVKMSNATSSGLQIKLNGAKRPFRIVINGNDSLIRFTGNLFRDRSSVIELCAPAGEIDGEKASLAVGDIRLRPLGLFATLVAWASGLTRQA